MRTRDSLETDTRVADAPRENAEATDAVETPRGEVLDDPDRRREESAESQQRADGHWQWRPFKVDRSELGRFDLKRAGLPDMSIDAAAKYIEENRASRPWLSMTDRASPEARRIIAALDAAGGHAHIRHEGWVSEEANRRRVAYREDPAQLDPDKRSQGIDGLRPDGQRHRCADAATRIVDPDAFATAFARGVQHPDVLEALGKSIAGKKPSEVAIPVADLLGPDGYRYCTGWELETGDYSVDKAMGRRSDWIKGTPGVPEPRAAPVTSFSGGDVLFAFARNDTEKRYEVVTMYARPAQPKPADDHST